jgi:hypothetical protein
VLYKCSLVGSAPNQAARHHNNRPARETLTEAITTLQNNIKQRPSLEGIQEVMKGIEQRIEAKITEIGFDINKHTSQTAASNNTSINDHITQRINTAIATFTHQ